MMVEVRVLETALADPRVRQEFVEVHADSLASYALLLRVLSLDIPFEANPAYEPITADE